MAAIIFDCDGVLAETEREVHLPAFNRAFAELGVPIAWSEVEYGERLLVSGGKERIASALSPEVVAASGLSQVELIARLHARKQVIVAELLASKGLAPRPGIVRIVQEAVDAGWSLAVASTSAEASVRAVLRSALGPELAQEVAVFAGDAVRAKKPEPAIYQLALTELGLRRDEAIVIEDSRIGLLAAHAAGLTCVVTVSDYTRGENFDGAAAVLSDLGDPGRPMSVVANSTVVPFADYVTLGQLERALSVSGS